MNLPNKLTLLRMFMIPFFVIFMQVPMFDAEICGMNVGRLIALIIFIAASLTDTLDGHIARKYNLVTDFGKFMDPLADKLLVCSAMICLIDTKQMASWVVIIIIAREFIISGFRLVAADNGVVIAASKWGKLKTIVQMVMIVVLLIHFKGDVAYVIEQILVYLALALTIISLLDYLIKNKGVLGNQK